MMSEKVSEQVQSRSYLRRVAAMKGEPAPTFVEEPAAPKLCTRDHMHTPEQGCWEPAAKCPTCGSRRKDTLGQINYGSDGQIRATGAGVWPSNCRDEWHKEPAAKPEPHKHDWHEIDAWGTEQCRICGTFDTEIEEPFGQDLRNRIKAIVRWLEENQPDVFKRGLWDAINEADARDSAKLVCKARASDMGASDPQECDWPVCGCDPYADKVIAALQESGLIGDSAKHSREGK